MPDVIVVALITSGCTLIGVILTSWATIRKTEESIKVSQAITDTKLEALTEEVKKHNNFAVRIPVFEERLDRIDEELKGLKGALYKN